jgi:hypothetical protein
VCNDPATTNTKHCLCLPLNQTSNQSLQPLLVTTSKTKLHFRVILYLFTFHPICYHTRRRYSTDIQTPSWQNEQKATTESPWFWVHGYMDTYEYTTTRQHYLVCRSPNNQITYTHPGSGPFFSPRRKLLPLHYTCSSNLLRDVTEPQHHIQPHSSSQQTNELLPYLVHTWVHTTTNDTKRHDTHLSNSRYSYRLVSSNFIPLTYSVDPLSQHLRLDHFFKSILPGCTRVYYTHSEPFPFRQSFTLTNYTKSTLHN